MVFRDAGTARLLPSLKIQLSAEGVSPPSGPTPLVGFPPPGLRGRIPGYPGIVQGDFCSGTPLAETWFVGAWEINTANPVALPAVRTEREKSRRWDGPPQP